MFLARATCRLSAAVLLWLACAGFAQPAVASAPIDDVYLALGHGDMAVALRDSASLLQQPTADVRDQADVLQARLDVLGQQDKFDGPMATDLQGRIDAFVAQHPDRSGLSERLQLARAWTNHDAAAVIAIADRIEVSLPQAQATEQAELRSAVAAALAGAGGRFDRARPLAEAALEFWRNQLGIKASWQQVRLAHLLARAERNAGNLARALDLLEDASQRARRDFGADSAARVSIDKARTGLLSELGRNREGLQVREAVLDAVRHRYGATAIQTAEAEAALGSGLQEIGDYEVANAHYAQALSIFARVPDAPARERAIMYTNYGNLLQEMGAEDKALDSYKHALALLGDEAATAHTRSIITSNIGNTEFHLHQYATAKADFLKALALRERADGANSPGLAYALDGLGSACLALREFAEAERHYRRALKLRGLRLAENHPTLGPLRFGLALARWGQHDARGAFDLAVQTARHQHAAMAVFANDFAERQSMAYSELQTPATALAVTLAAQLGDASSITTAWELAMAQRGLIARAQKQRLAAARARHDPAVATALARWQRANSALGEALFSTTDDPKKLQALRQQAEVAERALWPHEAASPEHASRVPAVAELAQALPEDGLLIAYSEGVARDPARALTAGQQQDPEDWYAFVLDHRGAAQLVRVGKIRAVSAQIHAWYLDLRNAASDPARLRADGLALRRAVYDPLVGLNHPEHLFVIPEGELYRINFAALPTRAGYLIESMAGVQSLTQEYELLLASSRVAHPVALLAGAPQLGARGAAAQVRQQSCRSTPIRFAPIPNAARELDVLRDVLDATAVGAQVTVLSAERATRALVVPALTRVNVAHLATHGFSTDEDCADADGARGVSLAGAVARQGTHSEAAFSGLALSAPRGSDATMDVLSAAELATLDLKDLDWIVLSACDSGLGAIGRNEGVFGMRRALRVAGARTVIMSLWPVDDAATVGLMRALYQARFVERRDVPTALGQAMRGELARRRKAGLPEQPYYWAAFVSEGAWH